MKLVIDVPLDKGEVAYIGIKHRSNSMPVLAAALFAGVDLSKAYKYAHIYLGWATDTLENRMDVFRNLGDVLSDFCDDVGEVAGTQFHQELHRAFIEGRLRQSAFK